MKRLYLGLTLLLMAFLSTFEALDGLHRMLARAGVQRWMTELVLAAAAVAAFVHATSLHRRLLYPRRGLRLLLAGLVLYTGAVVVATGTLAGAVASLPLETDSTRAVLSQGVTLLSPLPLFLAAQVLLLVGVFRALTHLVPPDEFAEDF